MAEDHSMAEGYRAAEDLSMEDLPPKSKTVSNVLHTHNQLLDALTSFLTVTTHHILYLRRLYPPNSFLSTRAYNYSVRQNRHPRVCAWVNDAMAAIRGQLQKDVVEKLSLCIYECEGNRVLERWTFDLRSFPQVVKRDHDVPFETTPPDDVDGEDRGDGEGDGEDDDEDEDLLAEPLNLADLEAHFRATLYRLATSAARLRPLPEGPGAPDCSFTLGIEVKHEADRPVGRLEKVERKWIAADPASDLKRSRPSAPLGPSRQNAHDVRTSSPRTHAVRLLEVGELQMEVWVEEAASKFEFDLPTSAPDSYLPTKQRAAKVSHSAGKVNFDAGSVHANDLEPPDANHKSEREHG
jgi:mitotic spindle assembly checkpoint protein MAD2B